MDVKYDDGIKILLIEDGSADLDFQEAMIGDDWFEVVVVDNLRCALKAAMDDDYDAIVLNATDYHDIYKSLKEFKVSVSDTPIVVFCHEDEVPVDYENMHYCFCTCSLSQTSVVHHFKQFILLVLHQRKLQIENKALQYLVKKEAQKEESKNTPKPSHRRHDILKRLEEVKSDLTRRGKI